MEAILDRMRSDMRLKRLSVRTRERYVSAASQFLEFYDEPLDELEVDHVKDYLLHLIDERKVSTSTHKMHLAAVKFLFKVTLGRPEVVAQIPWPKVTSRLPEILSFEEVFGVLEAASDPLYRNAFMAAYGSGLRISETMRLAAGDIDADRGVIIVRNGKGDKDRLTILSPRLLSSLRYYWRWSRPACSKPWLFPGQTKEGHIGRKSIQDELHKALHKAGVSKEITFHSLRHTFATHLLESGVDLRVIQALLGHRTLRSTERYTQVRIDFIAGIRSPLELIEEHCQGLPAST